MSEVLRGKVYSIIDFLEYNGLLPDTVTTTSPAFAPYVIDSSRIPNDFWEKTTSCDKNCSKCSYCQKVLDNALVIA